MKIVWHWLILSLALFFTGYFMPRDISFTPLYIVLLVGAILYFVNMIIKPILNLITLPLNIITLGFFSLVLNGVIFYCLSWFIPGFHVASITAAIIGSVVVSVINWILEKVL